MKNQNAVNRAYMRLRTAIYKRAVIDYYIALINNDYSEIKSIEEFFKSCSYCINYDTGEHLISKSKRELEIAKKFINDFLESEKTAIEVNPFKISPKPLKILILYKFPQL